LDLVDSIANVAAGFGDTISFGLTDWIRSAGDNNVVDKCSFGYSAGKWAGYLHGVAFSGAGLLNGGARTVLWSGGETARNAARAAGGRLLEDTLGGKLLNLVNDNVLTVPKSVWEGASAVFSANAKGEVRVFLLNEEKIGGVFGTVEKPILDLVNRVHTAISGSPATTLVRNVVGM